MSQQFVAKLKIYQFYCFLKFDLFFSWTAWPKASWTYGMVQRPSSVNVFFKQLLL